MARVLVAGIGNIFLGDDGFGPGVVQQLATGQPLIDVEIVDYGIRGMHLAYDLLEGYDGLVLVDAMPRNSTSGPPGTIHILEVGEDDLGTKGLDAHGMDPTTVLASLRALGGRLPRTLVVGCVAATSEEGIGLSPRVATAVEPAAAKVRSLVAEELVTPRPSVDDVAGG